LPVLRHALGEARFGRVLEILAISVGTPAAVILLWGIVRSAIVLARLEAAGALAVEKARRGRDRAGTRPRVGNTVKQGARASG
jgi:hypothetical protein